MANDTLYQKFCFEQDELGTKVVRTDEIKFHDQPVSLEKKVVDELLLYASQFFAMTSRMPVSGVMLYSYSCVS